MRNLKSPKKLLCITFTVILIASLFAVYYSSIASKDDKQKKFTYNQMQKISVYYPISLKDNNIENDIGMIPILTVCNTEKDEYNKDGPTSWRNLFFPLIKPLNNNSIEVTNNTVVTESEQTLSLFISSKLVTQSWTNIVETEGTYIPFTSKVVTQNQAPPYYYFSDIKYAGRLARKTTRHFYSSGYAQIDCEKWRKTDIYVTQYSGYAYGVFMKINMSGRNLKGSGE